MSATDATAPAAVPGPRDRVTFFEAQRRHRRAALALSALCALTVVVMGAVAAVLATPAVVITFAIALGIAQIFLPLPHALWAPIDGYMEAFGVAFEPTAAAASRLAAALVVLAPGVLVTLAVWLLLRRWLLAAGVEGVLHALRARPARTDDFEERQLGNVTAEIAVAAGVASPRLVLVDGDAANAGVLGTSPDDATLVVARRLLDELDRSETQALVAHLVGSAANGDLRASLLVVSVFQTMAVVLTILDVPMSASARAALAEVARAVNPLHAASRPEDVERMAQLLAGRLDPVTMDDVSRFLDFESERNLLRRVLKLARAMAFLPLAFFGILAKLVVLLTVLFVLGPLLALALRSRRYLADATAVALTRNPRTLSRALAELAQRGAAMPAGRWIEHLFVVGPGAPSGAGDPHEGGFARRHGIVVALHPSLAKRQARVAAQGG